MDRVKFFVPIHPRVEATFEVLERKQSIGIQTLNQIHGAEGFEIHRDGECAKKEGDYLWTRTDLSLGVFVADCTAILVYGKFRDHERVAAIHAGWRGTAKGLIEAALKHFNGCESLVAWMSPSICQRHYEVGEEVIEGLGHQSREFTIPSAPGKFFLDLSGYQRQLIKRTGIWVLQSSLCTYCQPEFVSYRESGGRLEARQLASIKLRSA